MTENKHEPIAFPADRDSFLEWAMSEDDGCLSTAGLAVRCGMIQEIRPETPFVRKSSANLSSIRAARLGLSLEDLSRRASVALRELLS